MRVCVREREEIEGWMESMADLRTIVARDQPALAIHIGAPPARLVLAEELGRREERKGGRGEDDGRENKSKGKR